MRTTTPPTQSVLKHVVERIIADETAIIIAELTSNVYKRLAEIGEPPDKWNFISLYERKGEERDIKKVLEKATEEAANPTPLPPEILTIVNEEVVLVNAVLKVRVDKRCWENGFDIQKLNFQVEHLGVASNVKE